LCQTTGLSFWPNPVFYIPGIDLCPEPLKTQGMAINTIKQNKWFRRAAWTIGSLAALWAIAWVGVPPLLKSQLQSIASEKLGRKVTVGAVDFKPWTMELTLSDLAVATQDGNSSQFALKQLYIDAEIQSIVRLAPVVDAVTLDSPVVKLTHLGNGRYDIDDVLARLSQTPAEPPKDPKEGPPKFALFNVLLQGGSLDFVDRSVNKTHELRDLNLAIPFLSNLESRREVTTEPKLAFKFNGSTFDSTAQATPFAQTHKTDATIKLAGFDLKPYLGYIPASVPVKPLAAVLNADLKVMFEQTSKPSVKLSGQVEVLGAAVNDAQGQSLAAFDALKVALADVRPLEQIVNISQLELTAPVVDVRRDKAGLLNLQQLAGSPQAAKPADGANAPTSPWKVEVAKVVLRDGVVNWSDDSTASPARLALQGLSVDASAIALPFVQPLQFSGSTRVASLPDAKVAPNATAKLSTPTPTSPANASTLNFSGIATDQAATVAASLDGLPLSVAAPYLAGFLQPTLGGSLNAELGVNWKAPDVLLDMKQLTLNDLALQSKSPQTKVAANKSASLASIRKLEVSQAAIDLGKQSVSVGKLAITQPKVAVSRGEDNRWMFESWMKGGDTKGADKGAAKLAAPATATPEKPWAVVISDVVLDGGAMTFEDRATPGKPVSFDVSALKLQMKNVTPEGKKPSPLNVSARIKSAQGEPGQVDYKGTLGWSPVAAQGSLLVKLLPVHVFEPYFGDAVNIELLRADASFKGDVRFLSAAAGPTAKISGDVLLEEFRANTVQSAAQAVAPAGAASAPVGVAAPKTGDLRIAEELLNWKALSLRGLDVALAPGTATTVDVKETALTDFFARVIINETGRINLQDLVKSSAPAPGASPPVAAASASAPSVVATQNATNTVATQAIPTGATGQNGIQNGTQNAGLAPVINIGPVSLINGKVFFSDRFVKPNYSANLSELTGKLSAFSSVAVQGAPQLADLELRGRAEGTASLEILGKLNPLAKPLALDIKGKVRDLELPPLSPYSVKYAGYGIERGKMSVDVSYLVQPDGMLTASNNIILNQLTFGEKVEGAPNSLPVKLAVALLSDRNGVIDINLPINGSLNDPQFSLGPIIFKVIVNLIVKAITSPFSLLASAFGGGGDELSMVSFAPGSAVLAPAAQAGLDKVAKALVNRPALKMTVVGTASLEVERDGYKRERLKALLLAEKRRAAVVAGQSATAVAAVTDAEAPALLKEVYKRADIPKPRNLIGIAKDIPPAEMETLLLASISVTDDVMRELAVQRGVVVKDYLATKQLPVERLFLGAAKPVVADGKWTPRADLSLASN